MLGIFVVVCPAFRVFAMRGVVILFQGLVLVVSEDENSTVLRPELKPQNASHAAQMSGFPLVVEYSHACTRTLELLVVLVLAAEGRETRLQVDVISLFSMLVATIDADADVLDLQQSSEYRVAIRVFARAPNFPLFRNGSFSTWSKVPKLPTL